MVFEVLMSVSCWLQLARQQGWTKDGAVKLSHAHFGLVLGPGGKKFSSRDGVELTLEMFLDAGVEV